MFDIKLYENFKGRNKWGQRIIQYNLAGGKEANVTPAMKALIINAIENDAVYSVHKRGGKTFIMYHDGTETQLK